LRRRFAVRRLQAAANDLVFVLIRLVRRLEAVQAGGRRAIASAQARHRFDFEPAGGDCLLKLVLHTFDDLC
jgi:hypothetical protein